MLSLKEFKTSDLVFPPSKPYGQGYTLTDLIMVFDAILTITIYHVNKILYKGMPLEIPQRFLKREYLINQTCFLSYFFMYFHSWFNGLYLCVTTL